MVLDTVRSSPATGHTGGTINGWRLTWALLWMTASMGGPLLYISLDPVVEVTSHTGAGSGA